MKINKVLLTSAVLLALSPLANATVVPPSNLLVNGGFESSTFSGTFQTFSSGLTGWDINLNSVDLINNYWTPSTGSYSLDLNGNGQGEISQTFATVIGQTYRLSFNIAGNPDNVQGIKFVTVQVADQTRNFSFNTVGKSKTSMGWVTEGFSFTADGTSETLYFKSGTSSAYGVALDNISVTPVPEPESYAMMLAGLGLMGAVARRRRKFQV